METCKKAFFFMLMLFCSFVSLAQKFSISTSFNIDNFRIEKTDSFDVIKYTLNNDVKYFLSQTYPELPFVASYVLLPHHAKITEIIMTYGKSEICKGSFYMRLPNPSLPVKSDFIHFDNPELYAGYQINKVFICPFRYLPETNRLIFYSKVSFDIFYQTKAKPVNLEPSADKIKLSREFIRKKVINQEDIEKIVPLEEKIDYSGLDFFKNETDSLNKIRKETPRLKKAEEPFYIRQIK